MKIVVKTPLEMMKEKVLAAVPDGVAVSEAMLKAKLSRTLGAGTNFWPAVTAMIQGRELGTYSVAGPIMALKPPTAFYCRPFAAHTVHEQRDIPRQIKGALQSFEGIVITGERVFLHKDMPARWQQDTILLKGSEMIARGSFGEIAKAYAKNISKGRGKMVIHRIGTKFEPDPNKLLMAFHAAVKNAAKK